MKNIVATLLFLTTISIAVPLSEQDIQQLEKRKIKKHIIYETYLETDKGLASVFGYHNSTHFLMNNNALFWPFQAPLMGSEGATDLQPLV